MPPPARQAPALTVWTPRLQQPLRSKRHRMKHSVQNSRNEVRLWWRRRNGVRREECGCSDAAKPSACVFLTNESNGCAMTLMTGSCVEKALGLQELSRFSQALAQSYLA